MPRPWKDVLRPPVSDRQAVPRFNRLLLWGSPLYSAQVTRRSDIGAIVFCMKFILQKNLCRMLLLTSRICDESSSSNFPDSLQYLLKDKCAQREYSQSLFFPHKSKQNTWARTGKHYCVPCQCIFTHLHQLAPKWLTFRFNQKKKKVIITCFTLCTVIQKYIHKIA